MTAQTFGDTIDPASPDFVAQTVGEVVRLEMRSRVAMGAADRFADLLTAFSGSLAFVALHAAWFAAWIAVNTIPGVGHIDPYPFGLLTLIVSLEAIFLSTFVLISQNRQAVAADRRAKVDLQVNVIAEQEVTKLLQLVTEIHQHMSIDHPHDPMLDQMRSRTRISDLADAVDRAEGTSHPESAAGPDSAADTEA